MSLPFLRTRNEHTDHPQKKDKWEAWLVFDDNDKDGDNDDELKNDEASDDGGDDGTRDEDTIDGFNLA